MKQKIQMVPGKHTSYTEVTQMVPFYSTTINPFGPHESHQATTEITNTDTEKIVEFHAGLEDLINQVTTSTEAPRKQESLDESEFLNYLKTDMDRYVFC